MMESVDKEAGSGARRETQGQTQKQQKTIDNNRVNRKVNSTTGSCCHKQTFIPAKNPSQQVWCLQNIAKKKQTNKTDGKEL